MSKTNLLGSTLPLRRGNRGYFETTDDALLNEKSKFINLILTKKGERLGLGDFGCDLWRLLFEPKDGNLQELAQEYIIDAVSTWMNYLVIRDVRVLNLESFTSDNSISLYVRYEFVNNPLVVDDVVVDISASGRIIAVDDYFKNGQEITIEDSKKPGFRRIGSRNTLGQLINNGTV